MNVPFIDLKRAHDPIRAELLEAFARTLDHGEFCLGSEVSDFESGFASVQGASRVVGVGSGTEALHLIACALDLDTDLSRVGHRVAMKAREHGLLLRPIANTLLLVPPLIISTEEIHHLCVNTEKAISNTLS